MSTTVEAHPNWEWDGSLQITGAQTLQRYRELREKQCRIPIDKYGIFFAFSQEQFNNGYKGLVSRGIIQEGDKIKSFGQGIYGTSEAMKRWVAEATAIDNQIADECDPLEIYYEEYNNYECCLDGDGDTRAVEKVISIFGAPATAKALAGRRFRAYEDVDSIAQNN